MNCFVIMPFTAEFDDVYAVIKQTVENATNTVSGRCFRLDETRPAGRITDRLLNELRAATFCVADLTGNRPNVMWEIGFAMALEKPIIIITQNLDELPFDIKDMQSIPYSRNHLSNSLGNPLNKMVIDTIAGITSVPSVKNSETANNSEALGIVMKDLAQMKEIVLEAVNLLKNNGSVISQPVYELQGLCGHWLNTDSGSHGYARIIHGELVVPYCYLGNTELTGVYYDWRRTGDYWFARYSWIAPNTQISGFSFLKQESYSTLKGAWWSSEEKIVSLDSPPSGTGVPASWERQNNSETPVWAEIFFKKVENEGLTNLIAHGYR